MDYICGLIPARIRQALAELPETLDETYQRTLQEINKAEWKFAHRLFQFVAVASRPLRAEELAELLAFDFEAGLIPEFHVGWRPEDPIDAVLSTCSSFLAIVEGFQYSLGTVKVIQFSHFSVREFLTSARLAEASDIILRRYHISMTPAHTLAAQACLGILLHLNKNVVTRDNLKKFPLARYAAEHWVGHAQLEDVSRNMEDGIKQLFDPSKPHFANFIWIHDHVPFSWDEGPLPAGGTPLHYAAFWGLHSIVKFLVIEHAQDVNSRGFAEDNMTPLHLALEKGHVRAVRSLLECCADVTAQNEYGLTPLHLALKKGQAEVVGMLIEHGADATAEVENGETPLDMASRTGQVEVASMLIKHGADLTTQNKYGETPLHVASKAGQLEVASMLIERGADVTALTTGILKETPLDLASVCGRMEVAGMLIDRGADVTAQNEREVAPLHLASQAGQVEVVGVLIDCGADMTAQNNYGETPLHLASGMGQLEAASLLIERGADVTAQSKEGKTPLHLASQMAHLEVMDMLIECGADVAAKDNDGMTPLHTTSNLSQLSPQLYAEASRMLLNHGADVTVQDMHGRTPFDLASSGREPTPEVVQVLLQHGANPGTHENTD